MKHTLYIASILCIAGIVPVYAQIDFSIPDTICAEEQFTPINNSRTANTYFWHFCLGNLSYTPTAVNLGSLGQLTEPAFIDIAEENGLYFGLATNHLSGNVIRMQFGNSLLNTPVADDLGNFGGVIPYRVEGIQIAKNSDNNWFAFIIGGLGDDDRLVRLEFGNSLTNTPTYTNLGNVGNLDFPVDLYLFNENGTWLGFTVNYLSNTITRFNFGNSLINTPSATNLGNIGQLNLPFGICPVNNGGIWHFFISNSGTNSISRIDFGSSLLNNNPLGINLGQAPELNSPYDLAIINDCEHTFGFVANTFGSNLVRLDFPDGITGTIQYTSISNSNLSQPHGISKVFRVDNEIFTFVTDISNSTLNRLYYETCTEPSVLTSTDQNPPGVYYRNPGNYNITLILDQGLSSEEFTCRNIVVKEKPKITIGNDTSVCPNTRLTLNPGGNYDTYLWNNGSTGNSIETDTSGIYWVEVTNSKGCKDIDSIEIVHFPDLLWLGNDTSYVLGQSITLDAGIYDSYTWSTGENTSSIFIIKPGTYHVHVMDLVFTGSGDNVFCEFSDTINVSITIDLPNFITPNNDGFNDRWEPRLLYHYPEAEIYIYNRHGLLISSYHGFDSGWDGTSNGKPVEPDTYWFFLDLKDGSKPITGAITVKK